jgi:hypothetical protein
LQGMGHYAVLRFVRAIDATVSSACPVPSRIAQVGKACGATLGKPIPEDVVIGVQEPFGQRLTCKTKEGHGGRGSRKAKAPRNVIGVGIRRLGKKSEKIRLHHDRVPSVSAALIHLMRDCLDALSSAIKAHIVWRPEGL